MKTASGDLAQLDNVSPPTAELSRSFPANVKADTPNVPLKSAELEHAFANRTGLLQPSMLQKPVETGRVI